MHPSIARIHESDDVLRTAHRASDRLGRLTDDAAAVLRQSGGIRLLQAASNGGFEEDPRVFLEWVRAVASYNPSAGWIAGVVGVHPWEISLMDPQVQAEVYGANADTWIASPYAPVGRAIPTDGGFTFSGEWQYSTGTDHCDWVILGGLVTNDKGEIEGFPDVRHFLLPRGDYEIVPDSWNVMGLVGTGSKNIRIENAFVPAYRTIEHFPLADGAYNGRRADAPLYHLPFGCVFSAAIVSATFGIAQGALREYSNYVLTRVSASQVVGKTDPFLQEALAEAEADLAAGIAHVDAMLKDMTAIVDHGGGMTRAIRLEFRRNQVRAVQRVLASVDRLFGRAGSSACWTTLPLERYWRDLRTGGTHICNTTEVIYTSWANAEFETGGPVTVFC